MMEKLVRPVRQNWANWRLRVAGGSIINVKNRQLLQKEVLQICEPTVARRDLR